MPDRHFKNMKEFYPFYLNEHKRKGTRISHFIGTSLFFIFILLSIVLWNFCFILLAITSPYAIAWFGHFFIEKNKPAAFDYFWLSLMSDFKMYFEILSGDLDWGE
jgi:hypothetical protein